MVALTTTMLLGACGEGGGGKAATQVAAKVNKEEISVHQVNNALARVPNLSEAKSREAKQQILERLIDQELLVQKAVDRKLDRDPKVMQTIEAAKQQILAQAYLDQTTAAAIEKPTPEAIKAFYDQQPDLFKDRRVYRLNELVFSADAAQVEALKAEAAKNKSLQDITTWARTRNIRFAANSAIKPAEQLPLDYLARLGKMKDGDIMLVTPAQGGAVLVQVAAAQVSPMTEEQAQPFIAQFLTNRRRSELAAKEVKDLRQSAKIEYIGDFASAAASPAAGSTATAAPSDTSGVAPEPAANPAAAASPTFVDKGLKGLR